MVVITDCNNTTYIHVLIVSSLLIWNNFSNLVQFHGCGSKLQVFFCVIYSYIWFSCNRAIAGYLSRNLPYKLLSDDVYVTSGCTQAIELALSILARPGANILVPRPGFPIYELCAAFRHIEIRRYDLLPENGWEVDLKAVEALADSKTVAMVIINPGNPCGNVYSYQHLKKVSYWVQYSKGT